MIDYRIDKETAGQELDRCLEAMGLDPAGGEDKRESRDTLVEAIRRGWLVVNAEGLAVFTPQRSDPGEPLTFKEPDGAVYLAMDNRKPDHSTGKMFAVLAALTGNNAGVFGRMKKRDLDVVLALASLFLG
jgi:hypothetical protein